MAVDYPKPAYPSTTPTRPRVRIPTGTSSLSSRPFSAPPVPSESFLSGSSSSNSIPSAISPCTMPEPIVHPIYNETTSSWTYVIADPVTEQAVVIDPVLDYDVATNIISTKSADKLLDFLLTEGYTVKFILETRLHKTHISACYYLQNRLNAISPSTTKICMSAGSATDTAGNPSDGIVLSGSDQRQESGKYFDHSFHDYEQFRIGNIVGDVIHLPFADAKQNVGYVVGVNVFTTISHAMHSSPSPGKDSISSHTGSQPTSNSNDDGWHRLMNLPTIARVYDRTERNAERPWLRHEEIRRMHDQTAVVTQQETTIQGKLNQEVDEAKRNMEFYATQINMKGGRIPRKFCLTMDMEDARAQRNDGEIPQRLKIPKHLEQLIC